MKDIIYKSDAQRRLAEVLDELKIEARYSPSDELFVLPSEAVLIYEEKIPDLEKYKGQVPQERILQIHADGSLSNERYEARIKRCDKCKKFFVFVKEKGEKGIFSCPACGSSGMRFLSNNARIPGWFGEKKQTIIDEREAEAHLDACTAECEENIRRVISKLKGGVRYVAATDEKAARIKELAKKYPNMETVIKYILQSFETASLKANHEIAFKPIVLVGGPGCGKTSFVSELCEIIMERKGLKVDLGNDTAAFTFSGSDPSFKQARHGLIIESMFAESKGQGPLKNPVIHFDELDKVKGDQNYSVETLFYSILERSTARRFFDNYIGINVDASGINYIFTANKLEGIPAPIINRLRVFNIENYTHEQLKECVIDNCYKAWLVNNGMEAEWLPKVLSSYIKERILEECHDDPRSIEDAIALVFSATLREDSESGHKIALFSPDEIAAGWKNFRGAKAISGQRWKLPRGFVKEEKDGVKNSVKGLLDLFDEKEDE